jgi:nucleoside permease NupC
MIFVAVAPIINHIVWCVDKASETGSAIALLIVGLVITPVSWVHGVCLFFGYTWI